MTAIRDGLIKTLWRGNDPFHQFPRHLFAPDLQGWASQHPYLTEAVITVRPKIIVEIGVWKGGSVISLAEEARKAGLDCVVIAVDTWLGAWDHWIQDEWFEQLSFSHGYPSLNRKFMNNIIQKKLEDYVLPLPLDSLNAVNVLKHFGLRPDVVHLDGGHDYDAVMADLRVWWPLINNGGALIGDDYNVSNPHQWPGVKRAFDEYFSGDVAASFEIAEPKCLLRKSY